MAGRKPRLYQYKIMASGYCGVGEKVWVVNGFGASGTGGAAPGMTVKDEQYTGVPSNFSIQTADATVFTLAAGEIGFIQNLSADAPLAVKYGAGASTSSFNFILPTGTAISDGKGGSKLIDNYVGVVSVAKMAGTASYIAWKQAA